MLQFRTHEKNLFGQPRSWAAPSGDGHYVIEKSPVSDVFQPRYQGREGKPRPLNGGAWIPSFERAKQACEKDSQDSLRQRIVAKVRVRSGR